MVQTAFSPAASVRLFETTGTPPFFTQLYRVGVYPKGPPDSERVYAPAFTIAFVIAASPSTPEIGVGPEAESVQSVSTAVPPLSFITVF